MRATSTAKQATTSARVADAQSHGAIASVLSRYFEASLYLMLYTAVLTLVATGKLDLFTTIVAPTVLVWKGFRRWRGSGPEFSQRTATYFIAAYFLFAPVDYILARNRASDAPNPALYAAQAAAPVTVIADPQQCSFQFDPIGKNAFDSTSCDIAKSFLAKSAVSYQRQDAAPGTIAQIRSGTSTLTAPDPKVVTGKERKAAIAAFQKEVKGVLSAAGYPDKADPAAINKPMVVLILFVLVLYVTMVYGPIAALLVELFPARIRYSAMSLPYHIGNGWFGGFLPTTAFAMVAATGDIYYGLWYPIIVAGATLVLGFFFLPETFKRSIDS